MKKGLLITLIVILILGLLAAAGFLFRDTLLDILPIDQSGWHEENGIVRYLDKEGDPVSGIQQIQGKTYYFDPVTGARSTGWVDLPEGRSYFDLDGVRVTGWVDVDGGRCYIGSDGYTLSGWCKLEDALYFLEDGMALTGWQNIKGERYHFGTDGAMSTGWLETDEGRYFLKGDGLRCSGWLTDSTGTYYLDEEGLVTHGWQEIDGKRYYLDENGLLQSGWLELDGLRYYTNPDGSAASGWQELDGQLLYLNDDGSLHTGWLEWDGETYYLLEDGTKAVGRQIIDDETYYFTSTGASILLVNRWNPLPDDYEPEELVLAECGRYMTPEAAEAVDRMIADCRAAGLHPMVRSSYRTIAEQQQLLNNKVKEYGYDQAIQIVAIPGTSEHHTGLAIDISDSGYTLLNRQQGQTAVSKWLNEHCWDYGFIVRYPDGTTDITGIIYESWHYRYVGMELAQEMKENGLCLEEYLDQLTGDGSTCGNPDRK